MMAMRCGVSLASLLVLSGGCLIQQPENAAVDKDCDVDTDCVIVNISCDMGINGAHQLATHRDSVDDVEATRPSVGSPGTTAFAPWSETCGADEAVCHLGACMLLQTSLEIP